jgi:signal transduction histidine kinase
VIVGINEAPITEDAQRDVAAVLVLLDELEKHVTPLELDTLMVENNLISNVPMKRSTVNAMPTGFKQVALDAPLLDRIQIFNFEDLHWAFTTSQGNVYELGPTLTISTLDRLLFLLWFLFYLGFTVICMFWMWQWRRKVNHLNSVATDVAAGNLSVRANEQPKWRLGNINETVNQMLRKIESLVSSQRFLTNSVAHELRTPLSRMRFVVESLPERQHTQILALNEELDELDSLINDVLEYARADYKITDQPVSQVVVASVIHSEMKRHGVDCTTQLDDSIKASVRAGQLERILGNLLHNANKYGGKPERVTLQKVSKHQAELIVEDHGPGIPETIIENLFEPFFRGSTTPDGHGLGLAIVKQQVIQLGGEVNVKNRQEGGAEFIIRIPVS